MPRIIFSSMNGTNKDIDPASELREEDDDSSLPEFEMESATAGTLAAGRAAIARFAKLAPSASGVYRMIDAQGDVLYVGKAKNIRKRVIAYARPTGHDSRISRMIAATVSLEFVSTKTETEALLLEANLIKRLRPRFNVLLRDDKSFPYILITSDHWAPQILKHRGARTRPGHYYGPFASAGAVNAVMIVATRSHRTIPVATNRPTGPKDVAPRSHRDQCGTCPPVACGASTKSPRCNGALGEYSHAGA